MLSDIKADIRRYGHGIRALARAATAPGFHAVTAHRLCKRLREVPFGWALRKPIELYARFGTGCYINDKATIGGGLLLPHATGIVIGEGVIIGSDVTIFQNTTIGSSKRGDGAYPVLQDGVCVYAGAVLVGAIVVGANASVGAGAVLLKSVPPNGTAVGNPARIIEKRAGAAR